MKLTARQIQNIIKEELNRVIKESQEIYSVVAAIQRAFKLNRGSEEQKKELVNKLFDAYESISPSESEFAKRWIDIFYKEYKGFQKVVNADKMLKYRYFHSPPKPEFVSTQKDFSDTSNRPAGIPHFDVYSYYKRLKGKNLAGEDLFGKDLKHFDLSGTNLRRADMRKADLRHANLEKADLRGSFYDEHTQWPGGFDYQNSGAIGPKANLSGADLRGAITVYVTLYDADLSKANLSGANLRDANLRGANLSKADLSGADLTRTILWNANLTGANLSGTNLDRTKYSYTTQWPKGFDPIKAGAERR